MKNLELGNQHFELGDFKKAIEFYQQGLTINPGDIKSLINLCVSYFEMKDYTKSIAIADKILELDVNSRTALCYRANSFQKLNMFDKAENDYTRLIDLDRFDEFFYLRRSNARRNLGKFEKAEKDLEIYKILSERSTDIFFSLEENSTIEDAELDDFNLKRKNLLQIIETNPDDYEAYFDLGVTYTKILAHEKAIEAYSKAIELYPGSMYKEALFNRVNAYFDNYQFEECLQDIETYEKVFSLNPYLEEIASIINQEQKCR